MGRGAPGVTAVEGGGQEARALWADILELRPRAQVGRSRCPCHCVHKAAPSTCTAGRLSVEPSGVPVDKASLGASNLLCFPSQLWMRDPPPHDTAPRPPPPRGKRHPSPGRGVENPAVPLSACSSQARSWEGAGGTGRTSLARRGFCRPSPRRPARRAAVPPPRSQNPRFGAGAQGRARDSPLPSALPRSCSWPGGGGGGEHVEIGFGERTLDPSF